MRVVTGLLVLLAASSAHAQVQVVAGSYGMNCRAQAGNKTAHLAQSCNGQQVCRYRIDHKVIGDPAVGCPKEYVAEWRCGNGNQVFQTKAGAEAGFGTFIELSCAGQPATPPSGAGVQVVGGSYGLNCKAAAGNKTAHLAQSCNGQQVCRYRIDHKVIGDPAVGCPKEYVAEWRCGNGNQVFQAKAGAEAGFGTVIELSCAGQATAPVAPPSGNGLQILEASYGLNCGAQRGNVTAHLAQTCGGRHDCDYVVDHKVIGDPAVGCPKEYTAEWRCDRAPAVYRVTLPGEAGFRSTARLLCP